VVSTFVLYQRTKLYVTTLLKLSLKEIYRCLSHLINNTSKFILGQIRKFTREIFIICLIEPQMNVNNSVPLHLKPECYLIYEILIEIL
jgi:hypothetical protein